ncbi:protamine P1 family protein [Forsythia ovata]|uniref:Protamine P1 family protein n=1 Tax=Forsythia ovata TaxID=205694 RepID=A0ABD1TNU5_9LAMI
MMRFLRSKSNVGSRSRGRLRSSPMFYLRTKKNVIETTQEPSSPKVTCIGQVRVRRSSKSKTKTTPKKGRATTGNSPCWWLKKPFYWHRISSRVHKPGTGVFRRLFRKWGLFFCTGYCKKADTREDSLRVDLNQETQKNQINVGSSRNSMESENLGSRIQENKGDFVESSSPPKNALQLTRCRSAPYRASSLAGRFWGSPLAAAAAEAVEDTESEAKSKHELKNPSCENVVEESRNSNVSDELGNSDNNLKDLKAVSVAVHPLILTRCKSEPARTGERLNPESNFWKQTRLGNNS